MANVETKRCDICGKTYLSDEGKNDIILCTSGENGMAYNDICPKCEENIHRVIAVPNSIEDLESEIAKSTKYINILESTIKTLRDKICGWRVWTLHWANDGYEAKYLADEIHTKYNNVEMSRNNWRTVCFISIGFSVSLLAKLIFG